MLHQRFIRNGGTYRSGGLALSLQAAGITSRQRQPDGTWVEAPLPDPRIREETREWAYRNVIPLVSDESDSDDGDDVHVEVGFVVARSREQGEAGADRCQGRADSMQRACDGIAANAPGWLATPEPERRVVLPGWDQVLVDAVLTDLARSQRTSAEIAKRHFGAEDDEAARKLSSKVRSLVHGARVAGAPILAGPNGYWLPDNQAEVDAYLADFRGRIRRTRATSVRIRQAAALWYPQTEEERRKRAIFERAPRAPKASERAAKSQADRRNLNKMRAVAAKAERQREYELKNDAF